VRFENLRNERVWVSDGGGRVLVGGHERNLGGLRPAVLAEPRVFCSVGLFFHRDTIVSQAHLGKPSRMQTTAHMIRDLISLCLMNTQQPRADPYIEVKAGYKTVDTFIETPPKLRMRRQESLPWKAATIAYIRTFSATWQLSSSSFRCIP
jgi:hypothetical protein